MKKTKLTCWLLLLSLGMAGQNAWINELHYDDAGSDQDELVEIVIENPADYNLSLFEIYLYNGNSGSWYDSENAGNFSPGSTEGTFTLYTWSPASIQNGAPDGLCLAYDGTVLPGQFLSYEGTFPATDGPAIGLTSADIGVAENSETEGQSLQLSGTGSVYEDFTWQPPATATPGAPNNGQSFGSGGNQGPVIENIQHSPDYPTSADPVTVTAEVTDDNSVNSVSCLWGMIGGGPYPNNIAMSLTAGDTYQTDSNIPPQADNSVVYFIIVAVDDENDTTVSSQQSYLVSDLALVINEIHADPDAIGGDANGDGTVSSSQDEFVEILNASSFAVDISHHTLEDGLSERHTFPPGTIIQPGDALVVFGGGDPTGFEYYDVQTASSGQLGLNNGGDDIFLKDTTGAILLSVTYGPEGGDNQSLTRDPDFTGDLTKHSLAAGSGGTLFSPHQQVDGNWFKTVTVWDGSQSDNNWEEDENWSDGYPGIDSRAVLPDSLTHYPTLTAPGPVCNSLFLESGASLVGVDNVLINGFMSMQRTVDAYSSNEDGFHFLSSPVQGMSIAGSYFEPAQDEDDFYDWDETANTWLNYFGGNFPETEFTSGKAYLVAFASPTNGNFYGPPNQGAVTFDLSFTPGEGEGWNLLGNPYPSAIDWDLMGRTSGVNGSVYVLKGEDNTYISWNGSAGDLTDGHIPVNNGFFVKTASAGESVTMEPADQVHSSAGFLKAGKAASNMLTLKFSIASDGSVNNTYIQLRGDATIEFDDETDAYKLFGPSKGPQLFTSFAGTDYDINCRPHAGDFEMNMGFVTGTNGNYTISVEKSGSYQDEEIAIILEDLHTGNAVEIEKEPYSFQAEKEGNEERFLLHFTNYTGIPPVGPADQVKIFSDGKSIFVRLGELSDPHPCAQVFNSLGQYIASFDLKPGYINGAHLPLRPGIYIIQVNVSGSRVHKKLIIQ